MTGLDKEAPVRPAPILGAVVEFVLPNMRVAVALAPVSHEVINLRRDQVLLLRECDKHRPRRLHIDVIVQCGATDF